jgi:hypothetical protein
MDDFEVRETWRMNGVKACHSLLSVFMAEKGCAFFKVLSASPLSFFFGCFLWFEPEARKSGHLRRGCGLFNRRQIPPTETTEDSTDGYNRTARRAVAGNATSDIAHNHPSGQVEPSPEDHTFTHKIYQGAELLGLRFLDSIIVGDGHYFSFCDEGLLKK